MISKPLILITCLLVFFACQPGEPVAEKISNQKLGELQSNPELQLIDVRTPEETSFGTIPGAIKIDFYDKAFKEKINELDKSKPTVVYCAAGGRSASAMDIFVSQGFTEVYDLTDGYRGWAAENKN